MKQDKTRQLKTVFMATLAIFTLAIIFSSVSVHSLAVSSTLYANETDIITLEPNASDLDGDEITFSFSQPFNEKGQWVTDYTSAGEYLITITANDGEVTTEQLVRIIVEESNQLPTVTTDLISVNEDQTINFNDYITDPDADTLEVTFSNPIPEDGILELDSSYVGSFKAEITISDLKDTVTETILVEVANIDYAPVFNLEQTTFEAFEGETFELQFLVSDADLDEIDLSLKNIASNDNLEINKDSLENLEFKTSFDSTLNAYVSDLSFDIPYDYIQRSSNYFTDLLNLLRLESFLISSSDLYFTLESCANDICSETEITLTVQNINRAPEFDSINIEETSTDETTQAEESDETTEFYLEIMETEIVDLSIFTASDPDLDIVTYTYSEPIDSNGKWETELGDSSDEIKEVYITATDGTLSVTKLVSIKINQQNLEPQLTVSKEKIVINEGEEAYFTVSTFDPNTADELSLTLSNAPIGSSFSNQAFAWTADYDFVEEKTPSFFGNLISKNNWLNRKFSQDQSSIILEVVLSDGEFTIVTPVEIVVKDVNRVPQITSATPNMNQQITLDTTNSAQDFQVIAQDLDGDQLTYAWSFSSWRNLIDFSTVKDTSSISRLFTSSGTKKVSVKVCDPYACVKHKWKLDVVGEFEADKKADKKAEDTSSSTTTDTTTTDSTSTTKTQDTTTTDSTSTTDSTDNPVYSIYTISDWK